MLDDYAISKLPNEYYDDERSPEIFRRAIKKLILEKPDLLVKSKLADEIRKEITDEKNNGLEQNQPQEEANDAENTRSNIFDECGDERDEIPF